MEQSAPQAAEVLKLPLEKYAAALTLAGKNAAKFGDVDSAALGLLLSASEVKEVRACQHPCLLDDAELTLLLHPQRRPLSTTIDILGTQVARLHGATTSKSKATRQELLHSLQAETIFFPCLLDPQVWVSSLAMKHKRALCSSEHSPRLHSVFRRQGP